MSFNTLNNKIVAVLEEVSNIQNVYAYPTLKFDGYPSATVTPSENASDFETTSENVRNYAFIVRLFQDMPTGNVGSETKETYAFRVLRQTVDAVIDAFDKDPTLSGISLPTGYTMLYLSAAPSSWAAIVDTEPNLLLAEIVVTAKISFDITS